MHQKAENALVIICIIYTFICAVSANKMMIESLPLVAIVYMFLYIVLFTKVKNRTGTHSCIRCHHILPNTNNYCNKCGMRQKLIIHY